jgi:hypothetical protein
MGFKRVDLYPIGPVSTITPASKDVKVKAFAVTGSAAATATYAWLPANASIVDAKVVIKTACDGTDTTISVGAGGVTNSIFSALTVTAATVSSVVLATDVLDVEGNQPGTDIKVTAELGGAASTTGEFIVVIAYVM